mgnify:FL=1
MSPIKQQLLDAIDQTPDPLLEQLFTILQTPTPLTKTPLSTTQLRAAFGALKDSGEILGEIISPIVPLDEWDIFQWNCCLTRTSGSGTCLVILAFRAHSKPRSLLQILNSGLVQLPFEKRPCWRKKDESRYSLIQKPGSIGHNHFTDKRSNAKLCDCSS